MCNINLITFVGFVVVVFSIGYSNILESKKNTWVNSKIVFREPETDELKLYRMDCGMMGTVVTIKVYAKSREQAESACRKAITEGKKLEHILSPRDACSELVQLNCVPHGTFSAVSPELAKALKVALDYARLTDGYFDPTIGPYVRLWRHAKRTHQFPTAGMLLRAREAVGYSKISLCGDGVLKSVPNMRIDLGGIGKGMVIDAMGEVLRREGLRQFCLSSTSDVLAGDAPPHASGWKVAIDSGKGQISAYVMLKNEAVSTSGNKYQYVEIEGKSYSHIIDPTTGIGTTSHQYITIRSTSATEADALATACSACPPQWINKILERFPRVVIYLSGEKGSERIGRKSQ